MDGWLAWSVGVEMYCNLSQCPVIALGAWLSMRGYRVGWPRRVTIGKFSGRCRVRPL
jgi:hypothetical protein